MGEHLQLVTDAFPADRSQVRMRRHCRVARRKADGKADLGGHARRRSTDPRFRHLLGARIANATHNPLDPDGAVGNPAMPLRPRNVRTHPHIPCLHDSKAHNFPQINDQNYMRVTIETKNRT